MKLHNCTFWNVQQAILPSLRTHETHFGGENAFVLSWNIEFMSQMESLGKYK